MPIIVTGIILIIFGILAIYSVSVHESFTLTLEQISRWLREWDPSNYFYFFRQLRNIVYWLITATIIFKIPITFFKNHKKIIWIAGWIFILQLLVFIPWLGNNLQWARGWLDIPWLPSIQPSEFFKLWYILFLASRLIRKKDNIHKPEFITKFVIINTVFLFIFLLIPDLWTMIVLGMVGLIMFRYAWANAKKILLLFLGGLFWAFILWSLAWAVSDKFNYIQQRFTYFFRSDIDPEGKKIWRQNEQALIAIWWWWFMGQWYIKWLQKFWYIPEAQSDFIFAAFSEEIWFVWNMVLLWLYFYLCYYFLTNLAYIKDPHIKTIWVWIISLIIVQMFVNLSVNLKIMPNTGLTLPFISAGGTAIMVNMIEIVILYKILKLINKPI